MPECLKLPRHAGHGLEIGNWKFTCVQYLLLVTVFCTLTCGSLKPLGVKSMLIVTLGCLPASLMVENLPVAATSELFKKSPCSPIPIVPLCF